MNQESTKALFWLRRPMKISLLMLQMSLVIGCGAAKEPELQAFTGKVTYQGRPVNYGRVTLYPKNGPPRPPAVLNSDGTFQTKAAAGDYKVVVEAVPPLEGARPDPLAEGGLDYSHAKPAKSLVPLKYARPETSDATIVVEPKDAAIITIALR